MKRRGQQKRKANVKQRRKLPVVLLCNLDPSWESKDREVVVNQATSFTAALRRAGTSVSIVYVHDSDLSAVMSRFDPDECVVFNWCESLPGVPRSESLVPKILNSLGFEFTGALSDTLKFAEDKPAVKKILTKRRVPTPKGKLFTKPRESAWDIFPAIVKPAYEHSSLGISGEAVVTSSGELEARIRYVTQDLKQPAIVEAFIQGRELHVAILGNENPQVMPPVEMDFSDIANPFDRVYSYDAKFNLGSYVHKKMDLHCPAEITQEEFEMLGDAALRAYRALGCRDYARIDLRLCNGECFVLDVNPNCDLHIYCNFAHSAREAGYTYGSVIRRIVDFAEERHEARFARRVLQKKHAKASSKAAKKR